MLSGSSVIDAMRWHGECDSVFHVINRSSGEATKVVYTSEPFFFLHTINAYEDGIGGGYIVVDIALYKNPHMLHCMTLVALQTAQSDPSYATRFRGRPHRFVIPLTPNMRSKSNLVANMTYTRAKAYVDIKGHIRLTPQQLCAVGCETPTINYKKFSGKKYRYFYAITADVDDILSAGQIYKVDTWTGEVISHFEDQLYCAEPIFVARPGAIDEDDGVVVSSAIRGAPDINYVALLVLDAKNMVEIARAEFRLGGPVPKPLHGFFTANNIFMS
jgi:carotenoid isomerooxygenase